MATASAPSTWTVAREILSANPSLTTDEVMAKAKGVKAPDAAIRGTIHNVRSELKKKAARPAKVVPAVARQTAPPTSPKARSRRSPRPLPSRPLLLRPGWPTCCRTWPW